MSPKPDSQNTPIKEVGQEIRKILADLRELATRTGSQKQKILVQTTDSVFQYTVSVIAKPNATPTVALSVVKLRGRGAWGLPLTSGEMLFSLIKILTEVKEKYSGYVDESNSMYQEDVKRLKGVVE